MGQGRTDPAPGVPVDPGQDEAQAEDDSRRCGSFVPVPAGKEERRKEGRWKKSESGLPKPGDEVGPVEQLLPQPYAQGRKKKREEHKGPVHLPGKVPGKIRIQLLQGEELDDADGCPGKDQEKKGSGNPGSQGSGAGESQAETAGIPAILPLEVVYQEGYPRKKMEESRSVGGPAGEHGRISRFSPGNPGRKNKKGNKNNQLFTEMGGCIILC